MVMGDVKTGKSSFMRLLKLLERLRSKRTWNLRLILLKDFTFEKEEKLRLLSCFVVVTAKQRMLF